MMRYAVPALAAAGSAYAARCSTSGTTTISNAGDAASLAQCPTYTGKIAVATDASGPLTFDSPLQRIRGDISVVNAPNVTTLSGSGLTKIDGTWTLENVQTLDTLNFPLLTDVGKIDWTGLANLRTLLFQSTIQNTTSFNLQNTVLPDLNGIDLKNCSEFYIASNTLLQSFSMQLQNVSGSITLQGNGDRMNVSFPNLQWAQNITIYDVPSISMPNLYAVNGSIGFNENDGLETLSLPKLARVDEAFIIAGNMDLRNFSVPRLVLVQGAVNVANNSALGRVSFPSLTTVGGAFDAYGNFTSVSLPKITDIRGNFNIQSTRDLGDTCDAFDDNHGSSEIIKGGDYTCTGSNPQATGSSDGTSGGSDDSGSGGNSNSGNSDNTGAANFPHIPIFEISGVMGVMAAVLAIVL